MKSIKYAEWNCFKIVATPTINAAPSIPFLLSLRPNATKFLSYFICGNAVTDNINNNIAFKFNRKGGKKSGHLHPAVCLIRKQDYWHVGGCEEDLVGHYGWTDPSFWHRARGKIQVKDCHDIFLSYHTDGEADINRNHGHNKGVFKNKMRNNSWSKDFIRFEWEKIK